MASRIIRSAAWVLLAVLIGALLFGGVNYWRARQIREALYAALAPVHITNCTLKRFGSANDGGYLMCENMISAAESGYSYGIDGNDAWGCDLTAATGIPIHQYDCFNTTVPPCGISRTLFHAECVGDQSGTIDDRPFDTMNNQIAKNGDTGKRLIVKMDVEGSEWRALATAPDSVLSAIDQMAVEFHEVEEPHFLETARRLNEFFYVAHLHYNNYTCGPGFDPFPSEVFEVLFVNKRIAVANPWVAARGVSPLDTPNAVSMPDCQSLRDGDEARRVLQWTRRQARAAAQTVRSALQR